MNISERVAAVAVARPQRLAIVECTRGGERRTITYEAFVRAGNAAAERLRAAGIGAGDAVVLLVPMSRALYVAFYAILRIGAVAVFVDPGAARSVRSRALRIAEPRALVATRKTRILAALLPEFRSIGKTFTVESLTNVDGVVPEAGACAAVRPEGPALLTFTSGSTGDPKAIVRSHGLLSAQFEILRAGLEVGQGIDLATMPIVLFANLAGGATSVIPSVDLRAPGEVDARVLAAEMRETRTTSITASPALLARLATRVASAGSPLPALERIVTGGAPVFPSLLELLHVRYPHAKITAVYGSSEAEPIAHCDATEIVLPDVRRMQGGGGLFAGTPVAQVEVRIVDVPESGPVSVPDAAALEAITVPTECVGEIWVSGAHVVPGYLHGVGDAETKIRLGATTWHRTGDLGRFDERGRLWLLGRISGRVLDGRGVVYPFAVECAASFYARVRRTALVDLRGRRILCVEGDPDVALFERLRASLPWAKLDDVIAVKDIPTDRRHNAEIDYPALRKVVARLR